MRAPGRCAGRTVQVRSRMRGRGAGWAYPNAQVKGGGGGARAPAEPRPACAARALRFAMGLQRPSAPSRNSNGVGRARAQLGGATGWLSEGPARGIALRIGVHAAYARSARAEWACACGQPGLMVAYFPSSCCGDNHTVFGLQLCAQVHRCISLYISLHECQGHSVYV